MSALQAVLRAHQLASLAETAPAGWWAAVCRCGQSFAAQSVATAAAGHTDHVARLAFRAGVATAGP